MEGSINLFYGCWLAGSCQCSFAAGNEKALSERRENARAFYKDAKEALAWMPEGVDGNGSLLADQELFMRISVCHPIVVQ